MNNTTESSSHVFKPRKQQRREPYSCGSCGYELHTSKVCATGRIINVYSCPSCIVTEDSRC